MVNHGDWILAVKVSSVTQTQKKKFEINYIGVVLTMFPLFFRKKEFLGPRALPWSTWTQKLFFSQKPLKTSLQHFLSGFAWFCVLKKKIIFHMSSGLGSVSPRSKIFRIFLDDLSSQNSKYKCFSGLNFSFFGRSEYTYNRAQSKEVTKT